MSAELPDISEFCDCRILQLRSHIKIIIFDFISDGVFEQIIYFGSVKAGERYIKIFCLQIRNQKCKLVFIPFAGDFIECYIQGFFLVFVHFDNNALNLGYAHINQNLKPLMTADNSAGCLVPNNRLNIAKLLNRTFQLFIFRIAGF